MLVLGIKDRIVNSNCSNCGTESECVRVGGGVLFPGKIRSFFSHFFFNCKY